MKRQLKAFLLSPAMKRAVDGLERKVPLIAKWHRFEYEQHFLRISKWERLFSGVYSSFAAAEASIPAGRPNSYDNDESSRFLGHKTSLRASDYPVLFFLDRLLREHSRVFDFGGYTGLSFYSFERLLRYPDNLEWKIYDLPAVVETGRRIAAEKGETRLTFTTSFADVPCFPILTAFGSLHFPEQTFDTFLAPIAQRPQHILINKLPLSDLPTFYTVHNMGPALTPYRVQNRKEFVDSMAALGYELVESWESGDFACYIPGYPDHSVKAFSGLYFRQRV
jgi:putative methyltransferase (TIGR04325 family)